MVPTDCGTESGMSRPLLFEPKDPDKTLKIEHKKEQTALRDKPTKDGSKAGEGKKPAQ